MAIKKRGLGRGLDALLGGKPASNSDLALHPQAEKDGDLRNVPVELIQRGKYQPRNDMRQDSLEDLANSIRSQGVVQPIVVRALSGTDRYEIIAGERRWRAAQLAGLHEIPAVIRQVGDSAAIAMALIENIQREDLNPLEEGRALQRLIEEFDMTHQEAAGAVGRSRTAVTNLLRLLELGDDVKKLLENGDIEMGHARALLALTGRSQSEAAHHVVAKSLSVRETEKLVNMMSRQRPVEMKRTADPDIKQLQDELSGRLAANVKIMQGKKGKGKLVIEYNSLDELDGILAHIK